jgi:N-acetylmuramic acid 6-phosphate etherase
MSTERLAASTEIDRASAEEIVRIIQEEDRRVIEAVTAEAGRIAQAIDAIADRMQNGGRLFYVGAGTSGRIAMLDASELPPTYGVSPDAVQVIMAGGTKAYFAAVEGAEDSEEDGIAEVERLVKSEDAVIGIAASGSTPFTVAAIRKANMNGALTVGVTSAPMSPLAREVDIPVVVQTGPEVILGSTRMKGGTAQKLVLNTISTGVMIRLGRVYSNLMTDMPVTNAQLARRAISMVQLATGTDARTADEALRLSNQQVKTAIVMVKNQSSAEEARSALARHNGRLRETLES